MRRDGTMYLWFERSGGGGSAGVGGGGADGGSRCTEPRLRGMSLGIFAERSCAGGVTSGTGIVHGSERVGGGVCWGIREANSELQAVLEAWRSAAVETSIEPKPPQNPQNFTSNRIAFFNTETRY